MDRIGILQYISMDNWLIMDQLGSMIKCHQKLLVLNYFLIPVYMSFNFIICVSQFSDKLNIVDRFDILGPGSNFFCIFSDFLINLLSITEIQLKCL